MQSFGLRVKWLPTLKRHDVSTQRSTFLKLTPPSVSTPSQPLKIVSHTLDLPIPKAPPPLTANTVKADCIKYRLAIETVASVGGMVGIQTRRPIVLTPYAAREWTSSDTSVESALELLSTARPETAFAWHPVTRQMSNVKYQAPNTDHPTAI